MQLFQATVFHQQLGRPIHPTPAPPMLHLLIWSGREHPLLVHVSGEVEGVGHDQLPTMQAGRLDEGQGPDPLHHCVGLWRHLQPRDRNGLFVCIGTEML